MNLRKFQAKWSHGMAFVISIFYGTDNRKKSTETRSLSFRLRLVAGRKKEKKNQWPIWKRHEVVCEKSRRRKGKEEKERGPEFSSGYENSACSVVGERESVTVFTYIGFRFDMGFLITDLITFACWSSDSIGTAWLLIVFSKIELDIVKI